MGNLVSFRRRLGRAVVSARVSRGMSCGDLASLLNIPPMHLRNVENGRRAPSMSLLVRLLTTLDISMDSLLASES